MGRLGYAYNDADYQNVGGSSYNSGWSYRNDGVDIEACLDFSSNGFNVGWISTGDWLNFTLDVLQAGFYDIIFNISAQNAGGKILLSLDSQQFLTSALDVPVTGGWQNWQFFTAKNIYLPGGLHTLKAQFFNGGFNFSSMEFVLVTTDVQDESLKELSFNLKQSYPNPFNSSTLIEYSIPNASDVTIKIYDVLGEEIEILVDEFNLPGNYSIHFNAENLPSGVYLCNMQAGDFSANKKLILLR
jgi:hypothetical protein